MLTAGEIRAKYIQFFIERGHAHVPSSPLVPPDDPTLLFTTAGMVQFKALYSGLVPLPYSRAASVQKSLRAGGKGSDLENVGKTLRHHTFFEMLGNFSFGDYFKRETILWAWDFCTNPAWLGLPGERIWPTVYGKPDGKGGWIVDDEAESIWLKETGVVNPITRLDEKENFWGPAGESGACGPCSEIKFFMGSEEELLEYRQLAERVRQGDWAAHERLANDIVEKGDLFLEIWNLVFPQYDQQPDGSRLTLKNRGIDTGMGLERTTTAVQCIATGGRINTPYETDLLRPLIDELAKLAGLPYPMIHDSDGAADALRARGFDPAAVRLAMNACVDHARALTFALSEGIVPSNEGRGYVLRRILRRAARFGKKLGLTEPFLWRLVGSVVRVMGPVYPEIARHTDIVEKTIRAEEERFNRTLNQGGERLDQMLDALKAGEKLAGEKAYQLFDTFGYPLDLTIEAAEERGFEVDAEGFEKCLAEGKARARASWKGNAGAGKWVELLRDLGNAQTEFIGYGMLGGDARVLGIIHGDARVDRIEEGQPGVIVLDRTPFYAEAGGQIGDQGTLTDAEGTILFAVEDTQKTEAGYYLHFGEAREPLKVGATVQARVDESRRLATMANHSATHLMQAALKNLIGGHVTQQGSFVGPEGLRFDFTNPEALGEETLREIERFVNERICRNEPVEVKEMTLEEARSTGAIAPFGEKYGARVRVVTMGNSSQPTSREFCGGTHVHATGDIGLFLVTGESSVASGIRRLEARTGLGALGLVTQERRLLSGLARRLSAPPDALEGRVAALQEEIRVLRRQLDEAKAEKAREKMAQAAASSQEVKGIKLIAQRLDGAEANALTQAWDALKQKSSTATLGVFAGVADGKISFVVGATEDIAGKSISAGDVLRELAGMVGGKGGGKPNLARGGGSEPEKLDAAMNQLAAIIEKIAR